MSGEMTIAQSNEYQSFRSSVSQRKFVVDEDESKEWKVYDAGPRSVKCPLICFPPASGTADVFFRQILALTAVGYRVISVEYPTYWKIVEFCEGFRRLIDHLQLDKGFLAQKFAEYTYRSPRVASLILCNSFYDTTIFNQTNSAPTFWMMPSLVLKKMVMGNFDKGLVDPLDGLTQAELASRLTLNCMNCYVEPQKIQQIPITIMDVLMIVLYHSVREELYKCYPEAKNTHLKSGGNFPYLSRCDEVDIFIKIHLQPFDNKKYSAKEYVEVTILYFIHSTYYRKLFLFLAKKGWECTSFILRLATKARSKSLGPLHPSFNIVKILRDALNVVLPEDAHTIASGKLFISLTRVSDRKAVLVSQYDSKEELIQKKQATSKCTLFELLGNQERQEVKCVCIQKYGNLFGLTLHTDSSGNLMVVKCEDNLDSLLGCRYDTQYVPI
ncbi:SPG21 [Mytilus edulis]|uniref:SPG21 n=1 Tax=Mytilus edulis TaxID=6550 RepID=A0A8S3R118_MYTED|nr:SPG21 [Mytilus edulis]